MTTDAQKLRDLEEVVTSAEQKIRESEERSRTKGSVKPHLLHRHAKSIAQALWVYRFTKDDSASSSKGNAGNIEELEARAQKILNDWRHSLKKGDRIHCPDYMDEFQYDDESRGFVKLYAATVLDLAFPGTEVPIGDSSERSKHNYRLGEKERAIFVHYQAYSSDQDRWIVINSADDSTSSSTINVIPLNAHKRAKEVIQDAYRYPDYQSADDDDDVVQEDYSPLSKAVVKPSPAAGTGSPKKAGTSPSPSTSSRTRKANATVMDVEPMEVDFVDKDAPSKSTPTTSASTSTPANNHFKHSKSGSPDQTTEELFPASPSAVKSPGRRSKRQREAVAAGADKADLASLDAKNGDSQKQSDAAHNEKTASLSETTDGSTLSTGRTGKRNRGEPASDVENSSNTSKRKRKEDDSSSTSKNVANGSAKKRKASRVTKLDFTWICTECNEAECLENPEADLILCEGKCCRPFHYHCANLPAMPSSDEKWICEDCQKGRHQCALCQEYGVDDEDVFCCEKHDCGLFFHESCLSMQNVEVHFAETTVPSAGDCIDGESGITGKPRFTCPAHSCWTCTEDYVPPEEDEAQPAKKGKGRKKKRTSSSFAKKSDPNLFRCLCCPVAYHVTCIPPMARFHELALLCHEHAATCKLPYLDIESSMQGQVEAEYAKKAEKQERRASRLGNRKTEDVINPFFPGVSGNSFVTNEDRLFSFLQEQDPDHEYLVDGLPYCLPCDIQEEVYAKPPSYRHVHSLRYNPAKRPKRKPPGNGTCECKSKGLSVCEDSCLNRMVMIECIGDATKSNGEKNKYWNCDLGPSCSNRSLGQRKYAKCKPKREQGKGWGLVAVNGVKKGELVQEYVGEVINEEEKKSRLQEWARDHPNDPNFYVMQLDTGWYIDARHEANLSRFINHSCDPNCKLIPFNVGGYMRVGIFSLRDIEPGEFLNYDYQFDTKHGDKFRCRCGAAKCRGTMKGGKGEGDDGGVEQMTRREEWEAAKARYERDRKFLEEAEKREAERSCQVNVLVPAAEKEAETVAAGPNEKYRETAICNRLFLWRNAMVGGDFSTRCWKPASSNKKTTRSSMKKLPTVDLLSDIFQTKGDTAIVSATSEKGENA